MLIQPRGNVYPSIGLQTRKGNDIKNEQINHALSSWYIHSFQTLRRNYSFAQFRTMPCGYYNCHGLAFAARRTRIWDHGEVTKILCEDNYREIKEDQVLPGDTVVYYQKGDPQHSGIVIEIVPGISADCQFRILSKWGEAHEVIHMLRDCPYSEDADMIKFFRINSVFHGDI